MIEKQGHPDLFIVEPEGLTTKIETVREGIKFLSLKSLKLKKKVLIIKDAQSLSPAAANAFLKTLEEPPKNSFLAVCSSKLEGVLPTIISRCRKIFLPFKEDELKNSIFESAIEFLKGRDIEFNDRKKFASFLWALIRLLHNGILDKTGGQNNRLPCERECEIIFQPYQIGELCGILKDILKIYGAQNNINMNLALNLIRMRIK